MNQVKQRRFDTKETLTLLSKYNAQVFWSWGVSKIEHLADEGLAIWVNGHHHIGWVVIVLGWDDTYTYYLVDQQYAPVKRYDGVYFDELQSRIDKDVEYINDYN